MRRRLNEHAMKMMTAVTAARTKNASRALGTIGKITCEGRRLSRKSVLRAADVAREPPPSGAPVLEFPHRSAEVAGRDIDTDLVSTLEEIEVGNASTFTAAISPARTVGRSQERR